MTSVPDPPSHGGLPPRRKWPAGIQRRRVNPVPYVAGLLLGQGIAWLVLAALGFSFWIIALPDGLGPGSSNGALLWAGGQLLAIGIGAGMGVAEIGMACRLRGGPRWLLRATVGLRGASLASSLVVPVVATMVVGSVLELLAVSGVLLARRPLHLIPGGACRYCPAARPTASVATRRADPHAQVRFGHQ